ncbi:MAG: hypothetical protein JNL52_14855 [Flavobacteriales bacterium]|nr:hypothetical protein [Flavobacteriales bacterium]
MGILSLLCFVAQVVSAQAPQMIADIVPGPSSSWPMRPTLLNGSILFMASTPQTGRELWRTDGTIEGTELVKDIWPGPMPSSAYALTVVNGVLYFAAEDSLHGYELWKSDGTEAGTTMIKDINPVTNNGIYPGRITGLDGIVYFRTSDLVTGEELWRTDGTEVGAWLVKDINPGPASSSVSHLIAMNGQLLFWAEDTSNGWALWRSDGSTDGTYVVKDIDIGNTPSVLQAFYEIEGIAYFYASDTINGGELWRTDGTENGTWMVKDINPGPDDSWIAEMRVLNDVVIFSALSPDVGRELWVSDGTEEGTSMIIDLNPGQGNGPFPLFNPVALNEWLYFVGQDESAGIVIGIYRTDGINTQLVSDSIRGISSLHVACDGIFFEGGDGLSGWELWRVNSAGTGIYQVADINPGEYSSYPSDLTSVEDRLYFSAGTNLYGTELWYYQCSFVQIEDRTAPTMLSISPVPTADLVRVLLPYDGQNWDITISDAVGRIVHLQDHTGRILLLDASNWDTGSYMVLARNGKHSLWGRIVRD